METGLTAPERVVMREIARAPADAAVVTVVGVEGRAYRRPGAKMLVDGDRRVGAVTAGRLGDRLADLADAVVETDRPRVERFDLSATESGGNGVVDLLVEPADRLGGIARRYREGIEAVAATVVESEVDDLAVGDGLSAPGGDLPGEWPAPITDAVAERASVALERDAAERVSVDTPDGTVSVFVDPITPAPGLAVFGTGPDVVPVVRVASGAGFRVIVAGPADDERTEGTLADRFPDAERVESVDPGRIGSELDRIGYAVVMSHDFPADRRAVASLLDAGVGYVGVMGPQKRWTAMCEAFAEEGRPLTDAERARVHAPVGLALGSDEPYGVALSVVSEVLAVHHDTSPGHLG